MAAFDTNPLVKSPSKDCFKASLGTLFLKSGADLSNITSFSRNFENHSSASGPSLIPYAFFVYTIGPSKFFLINIFSSYEGNLAASSLWESITDIIRYFCFVLRSFSILYLKIVNLISGLKVIGDSLSL